MSRRVLSRLLLLGSIWGTSFLLIKFGLEGLSPVQLVLGRLFFGAAVLLVVVRRRRLPLPGRELWGHLAAMGVVSNIVPFFLFAYAEQRVASGLAGVLNGTTPLFTLVFAMLGARYGLSDERLTAQRVVGLLIGFAGTVLVVAPWQPGALGGSLIGQLACLAAAACYGVNFVYSRRFLVNSGAHPAALSAVQLGFATLILGVAAPLVARGPMDLRLSVVLAVVVLGAVMTGLAYLFLYEMVAEAGATSASMVTYLIPVVAVALGVVVLGEPLGWNLFAGAAVVIAGVALAEGRFGHRVPVAQKARVVTVGGQR